MKIIHIQAGMSPAGNAAFRLHALMKKEGIKSSILLWKPTSFNRNDIQAIGKSSSGLIYRGINAIKNILITKLKKPNTYFYSSMPRITSNNILPYIYDADIIYLHWIAGNFLSTKDIKKIAKLGKPVIFFMHDMWTMTGGCHHSFDCKEYENGCKRCCLFPQKANFARIESKKKQKLFTQFNNLYFVSPSEWMANCAKRSYILKSKPVFQIPNVIDEEVFKPINKKTARYILNLPQDKFIITFGCIAGTKNPWKGWDYLRDAINLLKLPDIHLVIYGSDYDENTVKQLQYPITFLGPILDEYVLSLICNSSDLFVSPSLAESFGLTFLENILCGTPVIGFDCTAIPEIVKTNQTGYLAQYKNKKDIVKGITLLHERKGLFTPKIKYLSNDVIKMHLDLINSIK